MYKQDTNVKWEGECGTIVVNIFKVKYSFDLNIKVVNICK